MTMILGYRDKTHSYILGDRACVKVKDYTVNTSAKPKIGARGDIMFGMAGRFHYWTDMMYGKFNDRLLDGADPHKHVYDEILPVLRTTLAERSPVDIPKTKEDPFYANIVVAVRDELFVMTNDFEVIPPNFIGADGTKQLTGAGCATMVTHYIAEALAEHTDLEGVEFLLAVARAATKGQRGGLIGPYDILKRDHTTGKVEMLTALD